MAAAAPAPPFSVQGTWNALRVPTIADLLLSVKAALAVAISLAVGFSQDLDNPYWSALTIYILVAQPQAGAIRSKALFRLVGTIGGGAAALLLAALFASHVGVLLIATLVAIVVVFWAKTLDRTPASYTWFAFALTLAIIGVLHVQQPLQMFAYATTRTAESCIGILAIGIVDSVILPRAMTPDFVRAMTEWRGKAADWAIAALGPDASLDPDARWARRRGLRALMALIGPLDALGVQLPYDTVAVPPRGHDLRFVRMAVAHLLAHLAAANVWIEAARAGQGDAGEVEAAAAELSAYLAEKPDLAGDAIVDHAERGEAIARRLAARAADGAATGDRDAALGGTVLLRLSELAGWWSRLEHATHAIATGRRMPPALRAEAKRARPVRHVDFVVAALDAAPLALSLSFVATVWYLTAWTAGLNAMLFSFVVCGFIIGTPGAVRSAKGATLWVALAFVFCFFYLFVALPRVTAFPVLIAVLWAGLIPLGLFLAMAPAGLLITANGFALLGLQNAYAADFGSSLQSLLGSMSGCLIAVGALFLCGYDRPRVRARRLARATARDVADVARARVGPARDRVLSLSVDRMAMFFGIVDQLPADDPLQRVDLVQRLRVAANVAALREQARALPAAAPAIAALRGDIAREYGSGGEPDRAGLLPPVEAAWDAVAAEADGPARRQGLAALTGLRVALTPDPAFEARMGHAPA